MLITTTDPSTIMAFVRPQLDLLLARGWEVTLVSSPGTWTASFVGTGVATNEIPMARSIAPAKDLIALGRWVRLLRIAKPDVVVGSTPKAGLLSMVAARMTGIRHRVLLHRGARWELMSGLKRRTLIKADKISCHSATAVIAVSNSLADLLLAEEVVGTRPTVLGSGGSKGVDLVAFHPAARRAIPSEPFVIGFLGRITADKGFDDLLAVLQILQQGGNAVQLRVGGVLDQSDPISEAALAALTATSTSVEWVGPVTDAPAFFGAIDALVFPSQREGLPNVVIEAAACGVPTVAFRVTGVVDAVDDTRSGILVDRNDLAAMAAAVCAIRDGDRGAFRVGAITWAKRFDQEVVTQSFVRYLEALVWGE